MTDPLALSERDGWPPHLRILADKYPRQGWLTHPNFDDLTRYWLDRHLGFREMDAALNADVQELLGGNADPQSFARRMARLAGTMIEHLHGHHTIEDRHYFPLLVAKEKRLVRGFDILESDHNEIDGAIAALTTSANVLLRAIHDRDPHRDAAGTYLATLTSFGSFLDRHLTDEEELVVPVILEHGGPDR
jgi:iron-sulfur cluster repair protein YtfE (RIC family)